MAAILRVCRPDAVFEPEAIAAMSVALDDVCRVLRIPAFL